MNSDSAPGRASAFHRLFSLLTPERSKQQGSVKMEGSSAVWGRPVPALQHLALGAGVAVPVWGSSPAVHGAAGARVGPARGIPSPAFGVGLDPAQQSAPGLAGPSAPTPPASRGRPWGVRSALTRPSDRACHPFNGPLNIRVESPGPQRLRP